jgi:dihydrofolate reductase
MRKIVFGMSVSLDGFFEAPEGDLSWTFPDEELHTHFNDLDRTFDTHLYGRRLYELMAAYWPTGDEDPDAPEYEKEYARIWRAMPKVVFSKTLQQVGWNSRLVRGDAAAEVNRLKALPGGAMSVGGAELAASLMQLGLIDEYRLYIHPVILGEGRPLFGALREPIHLRLVETRIFGSGVVLLRYAKAEQQ